MTEKQSQQKKILEHLSKGYTLTPIQAIECCGNDEARNEDKRTDKAGLSDSQGVVQDSERKEGHELQTDDGGGMKQKIHDTILSILEEKRADGSVLPFATSIEVAHRLKLGAWQVEEIAKGIEGDS